MSPKKSDAVEDGAVKVVSGQLDKRIKKQQQRKDRQRGVVFVKHLPHGFFEDQLQKYFEQFGDVTRLRLARSKRTGGSKSYAFIEFEYPEVAQVAAETMDSYLMFNKVVKAAYIPPEKQHFNYFKSTVRRVKNKAGKVIYISAKTAAIQRKVKNFNNWSDDTYQKRTIAQLKKVKKLQAKYPDVGIDFSKIIVDPKWLTEEEQAAAKIASVTAAGSKKSKVLGVKTAEKPTKKATPEIGLADLLGNTINDDSEDEDFIAMAESEDDIESSDEETYGFTKDSDASDTDEEESNSFTKDSDVSDTDENEHPGGKRQTQRLKPTVNSKKGKGTADRFEKLVKRKPQTGGIQKSSKKVPQKPTIGKPKNALQMKAAKELVEALPLVKNKLGKVKSTQKVGKKQKS